MAKRKIINKDTTERKAECGDCYYNGNCELNTKTCFFQIKKTFEDEESS